MYGNIREPAPLTATRSTVDGHDKRGDQHRETARESELVIHPISKLKLTSYTRFEVLSGV